MEVRKQSSDAPPHVAHFPREHSACPGPRRCLGPLIRYYLLCCAAALAAHDCIARIATAYPDRQGVTAALTAVSVPYGCGNLRNFATTLRQQADAVLSQRLGRPAGAPAERPIIADRWRSRYGLPFACRWPLPRYNTLRCPSNPFQHTDANLVTCDLVPARSASRAEGFTAFTAMARQSLGPDNRWGRTTVARSHTQRHRGAACPLLTEATRFPGPQ
jgi:hypothetical protein